MSDTDPQPPFDSTDLRVMPEITEHSLSVSFSRKITDPGSYGAATEVALFETFKFSEALTPTQTELFRATLVAKQKAQVFAELGLKAEVTEDGVLMEIARVFPDAKPAGRTPPPATSRAVAPPDDGPFDQPTFGPDDDYQAPPPRLPNREEQRISNETAQGRQDPQRSTHSDDAAWQDFFDNPKDWYDDLEAEKPRIKRKDAGRDGTPLWLSSAPDWVKDWATSQNIKVPAPPRRGPSGGGGGYSGGRTNGGGGYRR